MFLVRYKFIILLSFGLWPSVVPAFNCQPILQGIAQEFQAVLDSNQLNSEEVLLLEGIFKRAQKLGLVMERKWGGYEKLKDENKVLKENKADIVLHPREKYFG